MRPSHHCTHHNLHSQGRTRHRGGGRTSSRGNYSLGQIDTRPNRAIQTSLPGSKVPHWSCFFHFTSAQIADLESKWRYRKIRKGPYLNAGGVCTVTVRVCGSVSAIPSPLMFRALKWRQGWVTLAPPIGRCCVALPTVQRQHQLSREGFAQYHLCLYGGIR